MSNKTVAEKLQIKPGDAVYITGVPDAAALVGELPANCRVTDRASEAAVAIFFAIDSTALDAHIDGTFGTLEATRAVWICYPKGNKADINRDTIWHRVRESGWDLVTNVAVNDVWSALRAKPLSEPDVDSQF
jgi:hypothetical protein